MHANDLGTVATTLAGKITLGFFFSFLRLLDGIADGSGKEADLNELVDLCNIIRQSAFCGLGQAAVNPVISCIQSFRREFEEHLAGQECPHQGKH